jgi:hypothetical protein
MEETSTTDKFEWDPDLTGFGLRQRNGRKSWVVQYRIGGKQRRLKLGNAEALSRAEARKLAKKKLGQVALEIDPAAEKQKAREDAKVTFKSIVADYLEHKRTVVRAHTYRELTRYLNRSLRALHGMPIDAIKRRDVALEVGKIARTSGATSAARSRAALSAFFSWCMGEGICEQNACIGTNKPPEAGPRQRVLPGRELAEVWHALPDYDYGKVMEAAHLHRAKARRNRRVALVGNRRRGARHPAAARAHEEQPSPRHSTERSRLVDHPGAAAARRPGPRLRRVRQRLHGLCEG